MLLPIFLVLLVGFGKTTSSLINNRELHHNSSVSSDGIPQEEINKNQQRDGKSMATNIITQAIIALLAREQHNITKSSNFPTLVATNISEQCHKDSVTYHQAYLLRVDWAKKSNYNSNQIQHSPAKCLKTLKCYVQCLNLPANSRKPGTAVAICTD
jgi:hypothetical protein